MKASWPDKACWTRVLLSRKALVGALVCAACGGAFAQGLPAGLGGSAAVPGAMAPVPYSSLSSALPTDQTGALRQALRAARAGEVGRAGQLQGSLTSPIAQHLVEWAMIDAAGNKLDYATLVRDQRDLDGWPRPVRLRASLEKSLEGAALPPAQVVALFQGRDPETAEGAMALASAYQSLGRPAEAKAIVEHVWRNHEFEQPQQAQMLQRFGVDLTPQDHAARLEMLLYGSAGPAARALLDLIAPEQRLVAQARIAFHEGRSNAPELLGQVPSALQNDPGLAFDRARYFRKHNLDVMAAGLVRYFPAATPEQPSVSKAVWAERRALMYAALQSGDYAGAYAAASNHGLQPGTDYNEAEFFAGWIALTRLRSPDLADQHFAKLQADGQTPITQARALYWRGRTAETKGDHLQANLFWGDGARYYTVFYGQLSAARIGQQTLSLGVDPAPSAEQRAQFEGRSVIKAARMLGEAGERELFATFVMAAEEDLSSAAELGLLVDMTRLYGDQSLSMRVVRAGAMRGLYLPDRGYPVRMAPMGPGLAEPAFVFAITRQESSFDPMARSYVGARGMMQLMPGTAPALARRLGEAYSPSRLDDPDYNMKLGASYLGQLTDDFSGSYLLATAAYNAGPGRPPQWIAACGDPRQAGDPADFVECIPFSETRDYVMRVMEAMQVYRARLNGGSAPLTIAADLKRGGWTATPAVAHAYPPATAQLRYEPAGGSTGNTMGR